MNSKCVLFVFLFYIVSVQNHLVPPSTSKHHGLYDPTDDVVELNSTTFNSFIYNRTYASYVEFYNAYCGHCRKFAPKWKEFATELLDWRDVVAIVALDCSADENNDLCREFEVMAYPTIRYFPPNYKYGPREIGTEIFEQKIEDLRTRLITSLRNETNAPSNWPILTALEENSINNLFLGAPDILQYIFVVYPNNGSNVGYEVALDLHSIRQISIRQVESSPVAMNLELNERPALYVINRSFEVTLLPLNQFDRPLIRSEIRKFIHNRFSTIPTTYGERKQIEAKIQNMDEPQPGTDNPEHNEKVQEIIKTVQQMKGTVFLADLELALKTTLFMEIPRYNEITGDRLVALQRYISVLNR